MHGSVTDRAGGGADSAVPALIAVDWGTSSFRAALTDASGRHIETTHSPRGILTVDDGRFDAVLDSAIAPWRTRFGPMPVLMSGMIGSRQGWHEAPYVPCEASLAAIARGIRRLEVPGYPFCGIVPGVCEQRPGRTRDVMRGEETQVLGALVRLGTDRGTFVLPGTHSKWVTVAGGAIQGFRTFMTGEVFAALKGHTILGRLLTEGGASRDGFGRGLEAARAAKGGPGELLHLVFSARTLCLLGEMPPQDIADYLSGLLIGAEVAEAGRGVASVVVVAGGDLETRYLQALHHQGIAAEAAPADSTTAGLAAIARAAGIIEGMAA